MRVFLFGDEIGLEILKTSIPEDSICGIVTAEGRDAAMPIADMWAKSLSVTYMVQPAERHGNRYNDFLSWVKGINPDIGIVCSYSLIFDEALLAIPTKGLFNLHGGLLPEYRGANVLNWVLINGEKETGITLHRVVREVDSGNVVAQKKVPVDFTDTALTLRTKMKKQTVELMRENWNLLCLNPVPAFAQDESRAKRWPRRKPEDGLINWNLTAMEIYNFIRALVFPWPGAFYYDENGNKIIIDYFLPLRDVEEMQKKQIGYVVGA